MSYSDNPEQDAARHIDEAATADAEREALESAIKDDILSAFTVQVLALGPANVTLPHPAYTHTVKDAALDLVMDEKIGTLFADVLQHSACPHVKAMLKAMAEEYSRMWVDDLVEGAM